MPRSCDSRTASGVDAVIDAVGSPESFEAVRRRSCASVARSPIVGFPPPGDIPFPLQALVFKNVTVRMGLTDQSNMPFLMRLCRSGKVDVDPLITHVMSLDEFDKAFTTFANKEDNCMKIVLKP